MARLCAGNLLSDRFYRSLIAFTNISLVHVCEKIRMTTGVRLQAETRTSVAAPL